MTGTSVGKEVLLTLHTPVIHIEGGPTDIAYENGMGDFTRISHRRRRSPICRSATEGRSTNPMAARPHRWR